MLDNSLESLFVMIDDWAQSQGLSVREGLGRQRRREGKLCLSEILALLVLYPSAQFRHFKAFHSYAREHLSSAFPGIPSYGRLKLLANDAHPALERMLSSLERPLRGVGAIDSTLLPIGRHWLKSERKSLRRQAALGHGTNGECLGFKLTLATGSDGSVLAHDCGPASRHDLAPVKAGLLAGFQGWILADSGYRSEALRRAFKKQGLSWIARPRREDARKLSDSEAALYRSRKAIESSIRELKLSYGLIPLVSLRSMKGWLSHLWSCLIAYQLSDRRPRMWATP